MKNIIICTSGVCIGGMEVLFANYAKFLVDNNYNVIFLTKKTEDNIFNILLKDIEDKIHFVWLKIRDSLYESERSLNYNRNYVLKQIGDIDYNDTYGVCGFFMDIELMISIFRNTPVKISYIWPHPLDWLAYLFPNQRTYNFKKQINNPLYLYQKELITKMHNKNASYYTSYAIFNFNKWYYEEPLSDRKIEGLPVQKNVKDIGYKITDNHRKWNILWVGRFDFYKNDAIFRIYKTLVSIAQTKRIDIEFNIVGDGLPKFREELKSRMNNSIIKVNFLGIVHPDDLASIFSKNDIGIAMGVTVKQMGYAGLPAILIDSLSNEYSSPMCCNWVCDIETGDDGDGMYYSLIGKPLEYRQDLRALLNEVFDNPCKLNEYSQKCKDAIAKQYSYENQYNIITERILNSKFTGDDALIFRFNVIKRVIYKIKVYVYKYVKTLKIR